MNKDILLHICCAPCATSVLVKLREAGYSVFGYFYNPSIHPWKELQRRLDALKSWAPQVDLPVVYRDDYEPEKNIRMLLDAHNRCQACFNDRLLATACETARQGKKKFTTTLTVSPYQNQEMILKAGNEAAEQTGTEFVLYDFRDFYRRSIEISREFGLYRQPYCGCIFSERDRYMKRKSPGQK